MFTKYMNKYILLFLIIIILLFIYKNYYNTFYNQKLQTRKLFYSIKNLNLNDTTSIFWTGGYDSTFRLCQLLIDEKKKVQPIYLNLKYMDSSQYDFISHRRNKHKELQTMKKIRNQLNLMYPYTKELLKPLLIINYIPPNEIADKKALIIHYKLGKFARPYTQYERLARFSLIYPKPIEVGVDKCGTGLDNATRDVRIGKGENCKIKDDLKGYEMALDVFKNIRMPIVHLDKKDMYQIATRNGYATILKLTWSCWFPKSNGEACGNCEMCKKRYI